MGSIFVRGKKLWFKYKSVGGKWINKPSGYNVGQEKEAKFLLRKTETNVRARIEAGETEDEGPLTVEKYAERWLATRDARGLTSASEDRGRMRLYVKDVLGKKQIYDVRPRHVRDLVRELRERTGDEKLAPRTLRNVYAMLHTMFHDAVVDELIATNPCVLHRGELPEKVDADPHWRSSAVFAREEVEALISDERIPEDRRVVYTILFLAGLRWGECAALRWKHYDADTQPLGRLRVGESYSVKLRRVKNVKTNVPREVPVHPLLAEVLADWREDGWQRLMGREPTPDDLIVPARPGGQRTLDGRLDYAAMLEASPGLTQAQLARRLGVTPAAVSRGLKKPRRVLLDHGGYRSSSQAYSRLREDLERMELRRRRVHDTRRTMITLALNDGARRDVLQGITHGNKGDIIDLYNTPLWSLKCQEMAKLRIRRVPPAGLGTVLGTVGVDAEELRGLSELRRQDSNLWPGD
jgi:integrase